MQWVLFWFAASVANAAAFNPNGNKTFLVNSLSTFFIKGVPVFSNGPGSLPRNLPGFTILYSWFFNSFIFFKIILFY